MADGRRQQADDWSAARPAPASSVDTRLSPTTATAGSGAVAPSGPPRPPEPDPPSPDAPRLDPAMTPPPRRRDPVRFEGGRRMPAYVDDLTSLLPSGLTAAELEQLLANPSTFGQSTVVLRGYEQALDAIDRELGSRPEARPADGARLLDDVRQTLRDKPKTLADGKGAPSRTSTRTERGASCGSGRVTTATGPRSTTASATRRRSTACTGRPLPSG